MRPTAASLGTGRPAKQPLVLLHGWGVDRRIWSELAPFLSTHFELVILDLPGYGRRHAETFPREIEALHNSLRMRLPDRAAYLGWSLGGAVAAWLAGNEPERVSRLITVATNPCFIKQTDWPCAMPVEDFNAFARQLARDTGSALNEFNVLQTLGDSEQRLRLKQLNRLCQTNAASRQSLLNGLALLKELDLRHTFANLSQAHLAILCEKDRLVPSEVEYSLVALRSDLETWCSRNTAHVPMLSHPKALAARILDFLCQPSSMPTAARSKRAVATSFGRAVEYDKVAQLQQQSGRTLLDMAPREEYGCILDLGCGSGQFTSALRELGQWLLSVDISEGMLRRACATRPDANVLCGDAEQLPVADASFDLLFCNLVAQWCEDLDAYASECARVLRPGGDLLLSTLGPSTLWEFRSAWRAVDEATHVNRFVSAKQWHAAFSRHQLNGGIERGENQIWYVASGSELARLLSRLGARNVNPGRPKALAGKEKWKRMNSEYETLREPQGLPVTWQLAFYRYRKEA